MAQDFSWDKSAIDYVKLYSELLGLDYQDQLAKLEIAPAPTNALSSSVAPSDTPLPNAPLPNK
jgi:starch synthase